MSKWVYNGSGTEHDYAYSWGRCEHAWLLRAEGLKYHEIGARMGLSRERVRQMIGRFGRRMRRAMRGLKYDVT